MQDTVVTKVTGVTPSFGSYICDGAALFKGSTAPPNPGKSLEKVA